MNKVILMGRPTRDPEIRNQSNGEGVIARLNLAVDRRFKKENEQSADFISCVSFGKTAEFIEKYVKQGTKIVCSGRIQTGSYTNKDNQKVYTTDVVIEECEFAESKRTASENEQQTPPPMQDENGFVDVSSAVDDDLPFK